MLKKVFRLEENRAAVKTEILAGFTIFMTMAYIICVQPVVLSACGMNFGSVMMATCIASAVSTFLIRYIFF